MTIDFKTKVLATNGGFVQDTSRWSLPWTSSDAQRRVILLFKQRIEQASDPTERGQLLEQAKTYAKHVLPSSKEADCFRNFVLAKTLGMNPSLAERYPDFCLFLRANHLDKMIPHHHHLITEQDGEPCLLLNGRFTKWSDIRTWTGSTSSRLPAGRCYLEGGLTEYNPKTWEGKATDGTTTKAPRPHHILSEEERRTRPYPSITVITDCRAKTFPEKALDDLDHSFLELISPQGEVYYFGLAPKERKSDFSYQIHALESKLATLESPDHYVDVPPCIRDSHTFAISNAQFETTFRFILGIHEAGITYNIFNNSCVQFVMAALHVAGIPDLPPDDAFQVPFISLFPHWVQTLYAYLPLPSSFKLWLTKWLLCLIGYNRGEKISESALTLSAKKTRENNEQRLLVMHPRKVRIWIEALNEREKALREQEKHVAPASKAAVPKRASVFRRLCTTLRLCRNTSSS